MILLILPADNQFYIYGMQTFHLYNYEISAGVARVFLGLLFFFQGYDAVFRVGIGSVIRTYQNSFASKGIPPFLTVFGSWFTSYVELIGGLLLVFGLFRYPVMYLLGLDLIVASIAFGIANPMWDMRFVFPRLALLLFLLSIPAVWDRACLDALLFNP